MTPKYKVVEIISVQRHNSHPVSNVSAQPGNRLESVGSNVFELTRADGVLKVDIPANELESLLINDKIQPADE